MRTMARNRSEKKDATTPASNGSLRSAQPLGWSLQRLRTADGLRIEVAPTTTSIIPAVAAALWVCRTIPAGYLDGLCRSGSRAAPDDPRPEQYLVQRHDLRLRDIVAQIVVGRTLLDELRLREEAPRRGVFLYHLVNQVLSELKGHTHRRFPPIGAVLSRGGHVELRGLVGILPHGDEALQLILERSRLPWLAGELKPYRHVGETTGEAVRVIRAALARQGNRQRGTGTSRISGFGPLKPPPPNWSQMRTAMTLRPGLRVPAGTG